MRHCLFLDLQDDPTAIAQYEAHHRAVWPEVQAHLREQGVTGMQIWRLGTRLCMLMETDDERFDAARMARAEATDPRLVEWEALMSRFQVPTPWTTPERKWTAGAKIFDWPAPLRSQDAVAPE
jgi:L-rhamnose mutarotase